MTYKNKDSSKLLEKIFCTYKMNPYQQNRFIVLQR